MTEVTVCVEIAKGSHIKYEYDKEKNVIVCDRILHTPFKYPFNYGFILNTLSEDGDPLDVVILMDDELVPGCHIQCKILGCLSTRDDAGNDPKIIVCPINKIDPTWKGIDDIFDSKISGHTLDKIKYFFQHYKDLENKKVDVGDFYERGYAELVYETSVSRCEFNANTSQKSKITNYFERKI